MDDIKSSKATTQPNMSINPSHKISITHGSNVYVYWYVKQNHGCRNFDKNKDMDLVKLMYAKGMEMKLGDFNSFNINNIKNYHLKRKSSHDFVIKALN